jgi:hypothetical protein
VDHKFTKCVSIKLFNTVHIDPLLGNDGETINETTTIARHRPARQWTDWKAIFSAKFSPMAAYATLDTTMKSCVFYAVCAERL